MSAHVEINISRVWMGKSRCRLAKAKFSHWRFRWMQAPSPRAAEIKFENFGSFGRRHLQPREERVPFDQEVEISIPIEKAMKDENKMETGRRTGVINIEPGFSGEIKLGKMVIPLGAHCTIGGPTQGEHGLRRVVIVVGEKLVDGNRRCVVKEKAGRKTAVIKVC